MPSPTMSFIEFTRLVVGALEAANVDYLIGGSVSVWAWGEARTTRDFDVVVSLPLEKMYAFSEQLRLRDMLAPVDIILDLYMMEAGDLPINAIHLHSGYKAEIFYYDPVIIFVKSRSAGVGW